MQSTRTFPCTAVLAPGSKKRYPGQRQSAFHGLSCWPSVESAVVRESSAARYPRLNLSTWSGLGWNNPAQQLCIGRQSLADSPGPVRLVGYRRQHHFGRAPGRSGDRARRRIVLMRQRLFPFPGSALAKFNRSVGRISRRSGECRFKAYTARYCYKPHWASKLFIQPCLCGAAFVFAVQRKPSPILRHPGALCIDVQRIQGPAGNHEETVALRPAKT
jgi:hypothetical protein